MHKVRKVIVVASLAALAVTALAAPAAAAPGKGTLAIVNGIPGQRVDICINGKEIKSGLAYGGKAFKTMTAGPKVLKVFKNDPRTCRGTKLSQRPFDLDPDGDLTFVATKKAPRLVKFDNIGLGTIPPTGPDLTAAYILNRHAADFGANIFFRLSAPGTPATPAANPVWQKGHQWFLTLPGGYDWKLLATKPDKTHVIARTKYIPVKNGRRYELYLVGTTAKNAKFVVFSRAISLPPV